MADKGTSRLSMGSDDFKRIGSAEKSDENIQHLTPGQEDLLESIEPPFTTNDDLCDTQQHPHTMDLEKVASAKYSINNIKSVPNGGMMAWLQVLGAFFIMFNTWGIVNTFGTYQTYYEVGILSSSSASDISWIGSVQSTLLMLVGSLAGPVYDAGYVHTLLMSGSFLIVFGQMMLSLCTSYWQVFLAQAVCIGFGTGCLFVPAMAILSTYWSTRIATAIGIAATGSSIGGVIYPIVFYRLQPEIGFAWATRVIAFIMLGTLVFANSVMKVRVVPTGRRKLLDLAAFKEGPYVFFVIGATLGFTGLYAPFFYLQSYVIDTGLTSPELGFYILSIINAGSVFGRIIPNYVADKTGPLNMMVPCTFATSLLCFCLIATRSAASVIVIAALYGFTSGTFVSLPGTIFVHVTKNRAVIGTRMGMGFGVMSIGLLVGTPISGSILSASSFANVWVFGGLMTLLGGCFIVASRVAKGGWRIFQVV